MDSDDQVLDMQYLVLVADRHHWTTHGLEIVEVLGYHTSLPAALKAAAVAREGHSWSWNLDRVVQVRSLPDHHVLT